MTIQDALMECMCNKELVKQYERIYGVRLRANSPIEQMVDDATGYKDAKQKEFLDFCMEHIVMRALYDHSP